MKCTKLLLFSFIFVKQSNENIFSSMQKFDEQFAVYLFFFILEKKRKLNSSFWVEIEDSALDEVFAQFIALFDRTLQKKT